MQYIISFLEGTVTFVSSGILALLPVFLAFTAGSGRRGNQASLTTGLGFVLGFAAAFLSLCIAAGEMGEIPESWQKTAQTLCGTVLMLYGLCFLGVFPAEPFRRLREIKLSAFPAASLLGILLSAVWTVRQELLRSFVLMGGVAGGVGMLLCFALGIGAPFLLCGAATDWLKNTADWLRLRSRQITLVCGGILVLAGLLTVLS